MPSLEYYMTEARYELPGKLTMLEFIDAMNEMTLHEWNAIHEALETHDEAEIGRLIVNMLQARYGNRIPEIAERDYEAYLEASRDDFEEMKRESRIDQWANSAPKP